MQEVAGSSPVSQTKWKYAKVGELGQTVNLLLKLSRFESYYFHKN
jgi:hypothetical protein